MKKVIYERRTTIPAARERLFDLHAAPGAISRLTPPFEAVEVVEDGGLTEGSRVAFRIGRILKTSWVARITEVVEGEGFTDVMETGPFAHWEHRHRFLSDGPSGSILVDRVEYAVLFGWLGRVLAGRIVRRKVERLFAWRHEQTRKLLQQGDAPESARILLAISETAREALSTENER